LLALGREPYREGPVLAFSIRTLDRLDPYSNRTGGKMGMKMPAAAGVR